jgi:hypothetical protein
MLDESVGEARGATHQWLLSRNQHLDNLIVVVRHKTELAERAIPRVTIGSNSTWLHEPVSYVMCRATCTLNIRSWQPVVARPQPVHNYWSLIMTNTIDQTVNDYSIDTFYFMDNKGIDGDRSEPLYRALSWIEDDNEAYY